MKINSNLNINHLYPQKDDLKSSKANVKNHKMRKDDISISSDSSNLYKLAEKSNELIKTIDGLTDNKLDAITAKINNGYYQKDEVIDNIADSMLSSDIFKNTVVDDEIKDALKGYVEAKKENIQKLNISREKVIGKEYQQLKVYEGVADHLIDTYT